MRCFYLRREGLYVIPQNDKKPYEMCIRDRFATEMYDGKESLSICAGEYQRLLERHYLEIPQDKPLPIDSSNYEPLGLNGIGSQLTVEIMQRNVKGIQALLDKAEARIQSTVHQKSQAIWLLNELNRSASQAFLAVSYTHLSEGSYYWMRFCGNIHSIFPDAERNFF